MTTWTKTTNLQPQSTSGYIKACQECHPVALDSEMISELFDLVLSKTIHAYSGRIVAHFNFLERASASTLAFRAQMQNNAGTDKKKQTTGATEDGEDEGEEEAIGIDEEVFQAAREALSLQEEQFDDELHALLDQMEESP
jgi:hypothetical protein